MVHPDFPQRVNPFGGLVGSSCECTKMSRRILFLLNVTRTLVLSKGGRTFSNRNFEAATPWEMWLWVWSKVTIVTTVPLSVCYGGAKPLGLWVRTSNFVPCE